MNPMEGSAEVIVMNPMEVSDEEDEYEPASPSPWTQTMSRPRLVHGGEDKLTSESMEDENQPLTDGCDFKEGDGWQETDDPEAEDVDEAEGPSDEISLSLQKIKDNNMINPTGTFRMSWDIAQAFLLVRASARSRLDPDSRLSPWTLLTNLCCRADLHCDRCAIVRLRPPALFPLHPSPPRCRLAALSPADKLPRKRSRIGFDQPTSPWEVAFVLDIFIDIYFWIDLVLNFRTAVFTSDGEVVVNQITVARCALQQVLLSFQHDSCTARVNYLNFNPLKGYVPFHVCQDVSV